MPSLDPAPPLPDNERRRTPRFRVRSDSPLFAGVVVYDDAGGSHIFTGRVRDVGAAGLSVSLPPDQDCRELARRGREVVAVVSLPRATIELRGVSTYCKPAAGSKGYVIGVRLTGAEGEGDRARLAEFLTASQA